MISICLITCKILFLLNTPTNMSIHISPLNIWLFIHHFFYIYFEFYLLFKPFLLLNLIVIITENVFQRLFYEISNEKKMCVKSKAKTKNKLKSVRQKISQRLTNIFRWK